MLDPYMFSLALGVVGLGAMAVGGLGGHGAHHGGGHLYAGAHGAHAGHAGGGGHAASSGAHGAHGAHVHEAGHAVPASAPSLAARWLAPLLSPLVLFSILVGLGATGLAVRTLLHGPVRAAVALAGGIAFEVVLVAPLWNLLLRFASRPALTLETALYDEARAASGFDASGCGLVALELDGQVVQLLGTLRPEDRALGVRVHAGDRLRVEDVDAERNRCTVSYLGA